MEEIQLTDLFESYYASITPGIQTIITAKKEFSELGSYVGEKRPKGKGFQPFNHQKFTHRFLRAYDSALIISETGSGKSAEVLGFTELAIKERIKAETDPLHADEKMAHFKQVIVLVKGPAQMNEFRNQLVCKSSDGHFLEAEGVKKARTEKAQKTAITNEIQKAGYFVSTYETFHNRFNEKYTKDDDDKIAEDYADTIFWIDEGHNLVIDENTGMKTQKRGIYNTIWRVFHLAKRCKKIISTATPMINDADEVGSLLNLILPLDKILPPGYNYQTAPENDIRVLFPGLPFDHKTAYPEEMAPYFRGQFVEGYNFENATLKDLEPMLRGKISFIRSNDTGAIPVEQGVQLNDWHEIRGLKYQSQLKIYPSVMSPHQTEGYIKSKQFTKKEGKKQSGKGDGLYTAQRQAANFVFPDGNWGSGPADVKGGFNRYVTVKGNNFSATPEFIPYLENIDTIARLSCKYAEIIRLINQSKGNCFVYGEFMKSGVITFALCLEHMGFSRYNESSSMFIGLTEDMAKPLCSGGEAETGVRRVRPDIRPKLRYAILTRDTSDAEFKSMMDAMNSYENRHGDYIKVFISGKVGRDAINVSNVLQVHLIGADWNQSATYQALSRGVRATSHDDILAEERQKAIERGEDPESVKIPIEIYKHAALSDTPDRDSVDLMMYSVSENKDRNIKRVMRIMKQVAIGCQVHYKRNVRPTDVDGTPACDYEKCQYECADPPPDYEDFSTYDVLYAGEVLDDVSKDLSIIYHKVNSVSLKELFALLPHYREKYIVITLEKIIREKIPIYDRFGYPTYLREDNGIFYLDRTYPSGDNPSHLMAYYSSGLIAIEEKSLDDIVNDLELAGNKDIVEGLYDLDPSSEEFSKIIDSLSIESQVKLLEDSLIKRVTGDEDDVVTAVLDKFQRMIIIINEPITELGKLHDQMSQNKPKRGRKPNPDIKKRIKKINPISVDESKIFRDEDTEQVYLHILYSQKSDTTNYAATARFNKGEGRTRILKPFDPVIEWKDVKDAELPIYNAFIQIEIAKKNQPFIDKGLYGFILTDGKFRVSNRLGQASGAGKDARRINRGKVCNSWDRLDLIDVMWEIEMSEPLGNKVIYSEVDRAAIVAELKNFISTEQIETWSIVKLSFYYKWYIDKSKRSEICEFIKEHMIKTDRMM